ncbi:MAG: response regulator [Rhodospirillales bacterium]|nr:response regulator [Rhodospirillales bacterium]
MGPTKLTDVDVLLGDHDQNSISILRAVLGNSGFRNMHVGRTLDEVRENVSNELPDLLICDYDIPGGDFYDFVHGIRHSEIGRNPFLAIIAVTRNPSSEVVRRISECGADHLIVKPFSTNQMMDRIRALIETRKLFVVTSDYIGPDRRDDVERGGKVTRMNVPNTLKAKVVGKASADSIQRAIDIAVAEVNVQKLERYDDEIAFLVGKIVPSLAKGAFDDTVLHFLQRLLYVAGDASRRLVGTGYAHVSELCQALHSVTNVVVAEKGNSDPRDVQLLGLLSQAIKVGFGASEDMIATAYKISDKALSRFHQVQAERASKGGGEIEQVAPLSEPPVVGVVSEIEAPERAAEKAPTPAPAAKPAPMPPPQGSADGLDAPKPQAESSVSPGHFDDVFVGCVCEYLQRLMSLWEVDGVTSGPTPFLLSAGFRECLLEVVRKYIVAVIPENRRMVVLAGSVNKDDVNPELFLEMFDAPDKENVPRFLWNKWWGDIQSVMTTGPKTFGVSEAVARDGPKIWDMINKAAVDGDFDPPTVTDTPLIQLLFDFREDEVRSVMRGAQQVLQHEADEVTDAGASRNFFLAQIDSLPVHCGEWLALWAYYSQSEEFGNNIQKSFVASTGRTRKERQEAMAYYLRWAPDLTRTPLDDDGNIIDPEASEAPEQ